jgi:hypothetical protein
MDPLLQGRDRDVLVPDRRRQAAVWRSIGNPGVLLSGVDVVGTWRAKLTGKRLDVTVTPFGKLAAEQLAEVDAEAARVAAARGVPDVRVTAEG